MSSAEKDKEKMSDEKKTLYVVGCFNTCLLPFLARLGGPLTFALVNAGGFALHEYGKPKQEVKGMKDAFLSYIPFFSKSPENRTPYQNICAGAAKVYDNGIEQIDKWRSSQF